MRMLIVKSMLLTVLFCGFAFAIQLEHDAVEVSLREWAWTTGEGERMHVVNAVFDSLKSVYEVRHDQEHGGGRLGLYRPGRANWVDNNMLDVHIDGERFDLLPENNEVIKVEEGDIGKAYFSWEKDGVALSINFYMFRMDDKLFMEVIVDSDEEPESIELRFNNRPSGHSADRDFVLYTGERKFEEMQEWRWQGLELPEENWVLLTDDNLDFDDNPESQGPSAIAFLPGGLNTARVMGRPSDVHLRFDCDPAAGRFLFALWEFPGRGNREIAQGMEGFVSDAFEKMEVLRDAGF